MTRLWHKGKKKNKNKGKPLLNPERLVSITRPILPGYTWIPKGNVFVTRHCRARTLAASLPLYVVHIHDQPNKTLGLRVPTQIAKQVLIDAAATETARSLALESKDMRDIEVARSMLFKLYSRIPPETAQQILSHGFAKYSGRVGRTGTLDLDEKIHLAVQAHVRHKHTDYDIFLKTMDRESARKRVRNEMDVLIDSWSSIRKGGKQKAGVAPPKRLASIHIKFSKARTPYKPKVASTHVSRVSKPKAIQRHKATTTRTSRSASRATMLASGRT